MGPGAGLQLGSHSCYRSPLSCKPRPSASMSSPRTSTDDSPRRKMGATVTSGSLWKMLGLAWCWKWRKFHQWAEKPCGGGGGLSVGPGRVRPVRAPPRPLATRHPPHPHLQLSHHELLGHMVPAGLPEDGGVAQVMLQTPALRLGRGAGSGALAPWLSSHGGRGRWLPGGPAPAPR